MKDVYQFSITTGVSLVTARTLDFVRKLGMPLDVTALSKAFDTEQDCIRECIHFVNAQNRFLPEMFKTVVEPNPFLSGTLGAETSQYHATRWATNEILKVISYAENAVVPIQCSIFKTPTSDGTRVAGTDTNN